MKTTATLPAFPAFGFTSRPSSPNPLLLLAVPFLGLAASLTAAPRDMDVSFGTNGRVTPQYYADMVIPLAGGEVLVASTNTPPYSTTSTIIRKLTKDGTPAANFGTAGQVSLQLGNSASSRAVAIQPDGRIIVAGYDYYTLNTVNRIRLTVVRLLANGSPDPSFGGDGSVEFDNTTAVLPSVWQMNLTPDGKIILGGGL